ncbi:hypothetical protein JYT61_01110 [bacterium AH-315-E10]|nr:hypothetical protein [bacterium AH-315-E10]
MLICSVILLHQVIQDANAESRIDKDILENAIHKSAAYLTKKCQSDGKFVYCINIDGRYKPPKSYNVLRHAGAIYALSMYADWALNDKVDNAIKSSSGFLKKRCIGPVPYKKNMFAVWSDPELTFQRSPLLAKLGGSGLGMLALSRHEKRFKTGEFNKELAGLKTFIEYLQKDNGLFYSKYIPTAGGKDNSFESLYYPGEACMGLMSYYQVSKDPGCIAIVEKALKGLADKREGQDNVEADHWALLATAQLLKCSDYKEKIISKAKLISHAEQICKSILKGSAEFPASSPFYGSSEKDGRICPTATRLEGLLAAMTFLDKSGILYQEIKQRSGAGIHFLLRVQRKDIPYEGAFTRAAFRLNQRHKSHSIAFNMKAFEVRIDYVQHALSALIMYHRLFYSENSIKKK